MYRNISSVISRSALPALKGDVVQLLEDLTLEKTGYLYRKNVSITLKKKYYPRMNSLYLNFALYKTIK